MRYFSFATLHRLLFNVFAWSWFPNSNLTLYFNRKYDVFCETVLSSLSTKATASKLAANKDPFTQQTHGGPCVKRVEKNGRRTSALVALAFIKEFLRNGSFTLCANAAADLSLRSFLLAQIGLLKSDQGRQPVHIF
jgi:hypothetical protein